MVNIPVSIENLSFERLDLHRHYVVIDCDFTVYLILNPVGEKPLSGTDVAVINIGSWQIDAWKFLVRDNFPNEAGFSAVLAWDKTLEQDTEQGRKAPRITESDVDIADSVSSLKGQPVNITGFSLDDGKSLKVSTLENEYVNIRPFSYDSAVYQPLKVQKDYKRVSVGDEFPLEFIKNIAISIIETETGYDIEIPFFNCGITVVSATPSSMTTIDYIGCKDGIVGYYSNTTAQLRGIDTYMKLQKISFAVSDGVITGISGEFKMATFMNVGGYQNIQISGYNIEISGTIQSIVLGS